MIRPPVLPVYIYAENPAERAALEPVLQDPPFQVAPSPDQALVGLVCPSWTAAPPVHVPYVILGSDVPAPARLSDIVAALHHKALRGLMPDTVPAWGGWQLDPSRNLATLPHGTALSLTDLEVRLLAVLLTAQGADVSRAELLQRVWGYKGDLETHTVETHIYRLRQKLETDPATPRLILTAAQGYKLAGL